MSLWVALAVAATIAFFLLKSRYNYRQLPELPREPLRESLDATVIIPARNEEGNIARAVRSFLEARVVVVNDDSTDRTAEEAEAAGAEVMDAPPLKKGMLGKPNACHAGAEAAETKWLLFVDADTWYDRDFLPSILTYAEKQKLELVSVFPHRHCETFAEKMLLPYAFALYFCGVNGKIVNTPLSSESLANGQCLLFKREPYFFCGGHRAVAGSVIEDVALAARAKRHRMKARVLRAETLASVRMYNSFRAIWRGFEKNAFRFLVINPLTGFQVVAASIALTSWLPALMFLLWERQWIAAAVFCLVPPACLAPWYGGVIRPLLALPAIYVFQAIALNAMVSTSIGRKAVWKGRRV